MVIAGILVYIPQVFLYIYHSILASKCKATIRDSSFTLQANTAENISFILPVRREPLEYIEEAATFVHKLGIPGYELIIVSDDPPEEKDDLFRLVSKLRDMGVNAWIIWRSVPRGYRTGALNDGLLLSIGDYVYVIDVDSRPEKSFFERAVGILKEGNDVVAVVGRWEPLNQNTRVSQALAYALKFMTRILYKSRSNRGLFTYPLGTGTLYKAVILKSVLNGWDEERIQDDVELGARIIKSGYRVVYLDDQAILVENPDTYKGFRIQQARWAYGALDAAIARFKHILSSKTPLRVKVDAILYPTQYVLQSLVFLGTILLAILAFLGVREPQSLTILFTTWILSLALYSLTMHYCGGEELSKWWIIVQAGRLAALINAISPYIAYNTLKALLRIRVEYKRTPKGRYQWLGGGLRPPIELILGLVLLCAGVMGLFNGWRTSWIWLSASSIGYLYIVYRFPRDVFYS
jgi:cellulose synthase/poly-beta-1,6-N-acetylglucosamine synthase-like glycosyltransferase